MSYESFCKMVDYLVVNSEGDPELIDGLKWIDEQAFEESITFYEKMFKVLNSHDVNEKAKSWLESKDD